MYRRRLARWEGGGGSGGGVPPARRIALPEPVDMGRLVLRSVGGFAQRNKILTGSYVLGILALILVGGGTKLTIQQEREYNRIMGGIDLQAEYRAEQDYLVANERYLNSRGWFWSCDGACKGYRDQMKQAKYVLDQIREEGYNRMSDAKAVAGLFSEVSVMEVKDSFLNCFTRGKNFAKRSSMWDALFIGIRSMSRDESFWDYAVRLLLNVLMNFTIGLVVALIVFIFGLWGIVSSYQPHPLMALIFFVLTACAAFSFVMTYLMGIFGMAATGVYSVVKLAESANRQPRRVQGGGRDYAYVGDRPHYE